LPRRGACAEPFDKLRINSSEVLLAKTSNGLLIHLEQSGVRVKETNVEF